MQQHKHKKKKKETEGEKEDCFPKFSVRTGRFVSNYRLCPIYIGFPEPKYRPNIGFGSLRGSDRL